MEKKFKKYLRPPLKIIKNCNKPMDKSDSNRELRKQPKLFKLGILSLSSNSILSKKFSHKCSSI
jgi:hypothetical protein